MTRSRTARPRITFVCLTLHLTSALTGEIACRQFRIRFERLTPTGSSLFFLPQRLEGVSQIQEGFGDVGLLMQGLPVMFRRVFQTARLLQNQTGIVEQL